MNLTTTFILSVLINTTPLAEKGHGVVRGCSDNSYTTLSIQPHTGIDTVTDSLERTITLCTHEEAIRNIVWDPETGAQVEVVDTHGEPKVIQITSTGITYGKNTYTVQVKRLARFNVSITSMVIKEGLVEIQASAAIGSDTDKVSIDELCILITGVLAGKKEVKARKNSKVRLKLET